jgi:hypothetical protein
MKQDTFTKNFGLPNHASIYLQRNAHLLKHLKKPRMKRSENRVFKKKFGYRTAEGTEGWKELHTEESGNV